MAFGDPLQWVIIGVVVIVIFLWGPQKIPELARAVGKARHEYDQTTKGVRDVASGKFFEPTPQTQGPVLVPSEKTGDQVLVETAVGLGISTEGKTREQISEEIIGKLRPKA